MRDDGDQAKAQAAARKAMERDYRKTTTLAPVVFVALQVRLAGEANPVEVTVPLPESVAAGRSLEELVDWCATADLFAYRLQDRYGRRRDEMERIESAELIDAVTAAARWDKDALVVNPVTTYTPRSRRRRRLST